MLISAVVLLIMLAINNGGWVCYHIWKIDKLLKPEKDFSVYPNLQETINLRYKSEDSDSMKLIPIDEANQADINYKQGLQKIPNHIGVIPDGNRRWAKARSMPSSAGHGEGRTKVINVIRTAHTIGIQYLTFYAFSLENFKRDESETKVIFDNIRELLWDAKTMNKEGKSDPLLRLRIVGDITNTLIPEDLRDLMEEVNEYSEDSYDITITFLFAYNGRESIARSCNDVKFDYYSKSNHEAITEELMQTHMETDFLGPVDLIIRTSGEQRLSGFMTWESVYSEFIFEQSYWPDYDSNTFANNLREYQRRDRRFGGSS